MLLSTDQLTLLHQCRELLAGGFSEFPVIPDDPVSSEMQMVLSKTAHRLRDNFPYDHPYYLGQMLRPPHPVALLAYSLAMVINPNNHAHDGGRATSAMELEVVSQLAQMFGWQTHLGHLCSGGTIANFEALWVARELTNGRGVAASAQAHYTHERLSRVLGVPFHTVQTDHAGRMDLIHLEKLLQEVDWNGCRDAWHDGTGGNGSCRSAGRIARKIFIPTACRCRLWRILSTEHGIASDNISGISGDVGGRFDCHRSP